MTGRKMMTKQIKDHPMIREVDVLPKGHTRLLTKFMYPDGDLIDVFIPYDRIDHLTDFGETMRWVMNLDDISDPFEEYYSIIEGQCKINGIKRNHAAFEIQIENFDDNLINLIQCIMRISDYIYFINKQSYIEDEEYEDEEA